MAHRGDGLGPQEVLRLARDLVSRPDPATAGLWPRAAALLARQALESALATLWGRRAHGLQACSMRAQLLCLGELISHQDVAARARNTWGVLTRACHHHPYELSPTADELLVCFDDVAVLLEEIGPPGPLG